MPMPNDDPKTNKKNKPQPDSEPAVKKSRYKPLGGRKKIDRQQLSVRIDKRILKMLYALAERKGERLTEVLEHGGILAVEEGLKESPVTEHARYLVAKATPDEQWLVTLFLVYLRLPSEAISVFNSMDRETFKKKMYMVPMHANFREILKGFGEPRDPGEAQREALANSFLAIRNELVHGVLTPAEAMAALGLPMAPSRA
jgi:hypothetical protein